MPTRNVNLTDKMDEFIATCVESGRYANASEVMRSALRLLERDEEEYQQKMTALKAAIEEGINSPDAEDGVFERLYAYIEELNRDKVETLAKI